MNQSKKHSSTKPTKKPKTVLRWLFIAVLIIIAGMTAWTISNRTKEDDHQKALAPFYETANIPSEGKLGEVVRQEPLGVNVPNGKGLRVLYRTQKPDGTPTFSSGMIFIPNSPSAGGRPVIAWAHGTLGMGDQCAPSRIDNPVDNLDWLGGMLAKGWVVTATDYAGFGTPGTQGYLVGQAEANDVLNSVRAAISIPESQATKRFSIFGHSQGGHSALFAAKNAASYAPELTLVGTVAAAPAAEIIPILDESENTPIDWIIGPEILVSWPAFNPDLKASDVVSTIGQKHYKTLADKCIGQAAIDGLIRTDLKEQFFAVNPIDRPDWRAEAEKETAPILKPSQPLLVVESTTDEVIPPSTTEQYITQACQAGSPLNSLWIGDTSHPKIAEVAGPQITTWLYDQFAGNTWPSNCGSQQPNIPAPKQ